MTESAEARSAEPTPDGILVVDKPQGWTSHDVVARARRLCATRKVGHAGTLDPMATGVLVLGVGRATRLLTFLVGADKDYTATIRLGQTTVTDDGEGEVTSAPGAHAVDRAAVVDGALALTGAIEQVPSAVSAIKVKGERSYHRVRAGEAVELAARPVTVSRFVVGEVRKVDADGIPLLDVDVEVTVSSGTYVRALARDLGAALGTGGHLTALRRTRVGGLRLEHAHPVRVLDETEARTIGFGQRLPSLLPGRTQPVAAIAPDGTLVAMLDESRSTARSLVVFAPSTS